MSWGSRHRETEYHIVVIGHFVRFVDDNKQIVMDCQSQATAGLCSWSIKIKIETDGCLSGRRCSCMTLNSTPVFRERSVIS